MLEREEWLSHCAQSAQTWACAKLCTDPADRPRAENAIRQIYKHNKYQFPRFGIVWCGSPLDLIFRYILLRHQLGEDGLGDGIGYDVVNMFDMRPGNSDIKEKIKPYLNERLPNLSWVHYSIERCIKHSSIWELWETHSSATIDLIDAQHCPLYLSLYQVLYDLGLYNKGKKLSGLWDLAQCAGWIFPYRNICLVSERPNRLKIDSRYHLHCTTGSALAYPDGWSIYAVHGVMVPAKIVEQRDKSTAKDIQNEKNVEVRRVMLELFGSERYIREIGAKIINKDPEWGTLYHIKDSNSPIGVVKVVNPTPEPDGSFKDYYLYVPLECKTAQEAVCWTFESSPDQVHWEQRT